MFALNAVVAAMNLKLVTEHSDVIAVSKWTETFTQHRIWFGSMRMMQVRNAPKPSVRRCRKRF